MMIDCYEKLMSHGSPVYYSLKKVPAPKRDAVIGIFCFYQEIKDIFWNASDWNVVETQLNWWRGEVMKIQQGRAEHPVSLFLQTIVKTSPRLIDLQGLADMIDGLMQGAMSDFDSFQAVMNYFMRTAGVRERMCLKVIAQEKDMPDELMEAFIVIIEWVEYIQFLRRYVRHDLIYFPKNEMEQFDVSTELLKKCKTTDSIQRLLAFQDEKINHANATINAVLDPLIHESFAYLFARSRIAFATWEEIRRSDWCVLENQIQLTPLRMWWIAYRS